MRRVCPVRLYSMYILATAFVKFILLLSPIAATVTDETKRFESDFTTVVRKRAFVDKSLLIKALLEGDDMTLITAPRRFGKSTNMNMVKRFLEIEVTGDGTIIGDVRLTDNYKLFTENRLEIAKHEMIVEHHLGKHPVLFMDYTPLNEASDFDSLLVQLRKVLSNVFNDYKYLLLNPTLWFNQTDKDVFIRYCGDNLTTEPEAEFDGLEIIMGLKLLAELISKHFGRQIFVLIDDFDAYAESLIFASNMADIDDVYNLIDDVNRVLLGGNENVLRAFLTGVHHVTSGDKTFQILTNINDYYFLHDHAFCEFYGVTSRELDTLLGRLVKDAKERARLRRTIDEYYGAYIVMNRGTRIYNIVSIVKFFGTRNTIGYHWCTPEYRENLKTIFASLHDLADEIQRMIIGFCAVATISKPMPKPVVTELNRQIKTKKIKDYTLMDLSFHFLFSTGFLTITDEEIPRDYDVPVRVPNREVAFELANALLDSHKARYGFKTSTIESLYSVLDSIGTDATADLNRKMNEFSKVYERLFRGSRLRSKRDTDMQFVLYTILASRFRLTQAQCDQMNLDDTNILVTTINEHGVVFLIQVRLEVPRINLLEEEMALSTQRKIINNTYYQHLERTLKADIRGRVYVGIYYGKKEGSCVGYSYYFKEGDPIGIGRTVSGS